MKLPIEQNIFIGKKLSFFAFLIVCSLNMVAQKKTYLNPKDTMEMQYETFDFEKYEDKFEKYRAINYEYEKEDGTLVSISSAGTISGNGNINILYYYPLPYFYIDYVGFYSNGKLKAKGRFGYQAWPIGNWLECDEEGNCQVVDYDKNRGKFSYEDVLKFMEKRKHIDLKTGEGREQLSVIYNYEQQVWSVGTSRGYIVGRDYILDGNTGKVLEDKVLPYKP